MRFLFRNILFLIFLFSLINCEEEDVISSDYPRLKTLEVTEINQKGARFNAEIIFRGDFEILNYGFVWGEIENPTKEDSDRAIKYENIQTDDFSELIETTLNEGSTYFVRSFVETVDFTIYGENVSFVSLGSQAPEILSFEPTSGIRGDTVLLKGRNFSFVKNQVHFADNEAKILGSTDTLISVVVPSEIVDKENKIQITISGNTAQAKDNFILLGPELKNTLPEFAKTYEELIITGDNFGNTDELVKVYFNNKLAEILKHSRTQLNVTVPEGLSEITTLEVQLGNLSDSIDIKYHKPKLKNVDNDIVTWGDEVNLSLQNGYQDTTLLNLYLDEQLTKVNYANDSVINFYVPHDLNNAASELSLKIAGFDLKLQEPITLKPLNIKSISVDSVGLGEEISIEIDNLHPTNNKILINSIEVESALTADLKNIMFKMPLEADYYTETMTDKKVEISVFANNILNKDTLLQFKTPKISSINNQTVAIGDEVIVNGVNFNPDIHKLRLMAEDVEIQSSTNTEIRFIVPNMPDVYKKRDTLNQIELEITLNNSIKTGTKLVLTAPIIKDISPSELSNLNDIITVTGQNFGNSPVVEFANDGGMFYNPQTKLEIDKPLIELVSYSDKEIKFRITNLNLQNDKITQYLSSKIKIKSFGLYTISAEPINYKHLTNWKYLPVNPAHSISKSKRNFTQHGEFGFILGGYQLDGNRLYGERRVFQLDPALDKFIQLKTWNNFNTDYNTWVASSCGFQNHLYAQTGYGKFRRYEIKDKINSAAGWTDYPLKGDLSGFDIRSQFEHNNDLYFFTFEDILKVSNGDVDRLSTFALPSFQLYFSKKVNDEFFIAVKNQLLVPAKLELHKYNISTNSWSLITDDYILPTERRSSNRSLVDYLFDEKYVYDYDFITGNKSIRFEFPENFSTRYDVDLLFKLGNKWYFNIKDEQYLIYNEN